MPDLSDAELAAYMHQLPIAELQALAGGDQGAMERAMADLMPAPLLPEGDGRTLLGMRRWS